jgi:DNA-binding NarL/FixJ family response regulator
MRILIAERSLFIADRLIMNLNVLPGIEVTTHVSNPAGVIESLGKILPDVVIVDPHIGGNEGMELLRSIKRQRPGAVLIVMTNMFCPAHRRRCLEAGADYFLDKSNDFDRLPELMR